MAEINARKIARTMLGQTVVTFEVPLRAAWGIFSWRYHVGAFLIRAGIKTMRMNVEFHPEGERRAGL